MSEAHTSQRQAQDQFGRMAAAYGSSRTHTSDDSLVNLESLVRGMHFGCAVDVGTGPGFTAFAVAPYCERVIATDVTPQMLAQVRALREQYGAPGTEMLLAAAEALPFADASVDLVTCRTAAHHFTDLPRWLRDVHRVLRPGGLLLAADTVSPEDAPTARWMHEIEMKRDRSHVKNLAPSEWRAAVEQAGLQVTDTALSKVHLECVDWARRAGMDPDATEALRRELLAAPPSAKEAFGMRTGEDGAVLFHWDILVLRAVKAK